MISYGICLSLPDLLSMIISSYIHVATNDIISFFVAEYTSCVCVCVYVCVYTPHLYLFVSGHIDCFQYFSNANFAAIKYCVHIYFF